MVHNRKIIYLAGFIFSLGVALMSYINSSFIATFVDEKLVGTAYTVGAIATIFGLLSAAPIWRKIGAYKFLMWVIALDSLSILLFAFSESAFWAIPLFVLGFALNILIYFSLDELLKISSNDSSIGSTRGSYLALCSLAWIIAELGLGTVMGGFSFRMIYLTSFAVMLVFFALSYIWLKSIPDPKYDQSGTVKYLREFFNNKNLFRAYKLSFLLQFFFCWMVIYTPIYLSFHLGFSWQEIGVIFAVMLIPFAIIPSPLGKFSDKIGERKMLMLGFIVLSLSTLSLFFITAHNLWIWAFLLFATRVGASTIEVMNDAYFFKHIRPENEEFVGVYRSAFPAAYIIGPIFAFITLSLAPSFNFIYLVLGGVLLYGIYLSSTIERSDI